MSRKNGARRGAARKEQHTVEFDGGRMTRGGISANHLLNFSLPEREKQVYTKKKKSGPTRTQMEYLHANYRFVVAPLADNAQVSCWDIETLTEWKSVEQVLLWYDETSPVTCPICLDDFRAPKITQCGHIFCWPCILRYLSMTDKYWRRCPMCFDSVQKGQLRSVQLEKVQLPPRIDTHVTFQFLQRSKSSLFPHLRDAAATTTTRKRGRRLPSVYDAEAKYARILESTYEYLIQLAVQEMRDLETLETECRSCGDMDTLPFIEEAMKNTSQRLAQYETMAVGVMTAHTRTDRHDQQTDDVIGTGERYSFYQLDNGCYVVLHPLNVKCLMKEYTEKSIAPSSETHDASRLEAAWQGTSSPRPTKTEHGQPTTSYDLLPSTIEGRVVDVEHLVMDDEVQKRYRFLSHLPRFCDFYVCEIDLATQLSTATLDAFRTELKKRDKQRRAKQMASTTKQHTTSPRSPIFKEYGMPGFSLEQEGAYWPAPAELSLSESFHEALNLSSSTDTVLTDAILDDTTSPSLLSSPLYDEYASFATVTRNSGYFPSLGASSTGGGSLTNSPSMWGANPLVYAASPPPAPTTGKGKKGKKGTPLFSTTQRRSYR